MMLDKLNWLIGNWRAEALGGIAEEHWQPASGGSMMGSFKLISEDKVKFYELMTIAEEEETLVLRIKHMNPDLSSWEAQDECVQADLIKANEDILEFTGFRYKRVSDVKLVAEVDTSQGETLEFNYVCMGEIPE